MQKSPDWFSIIIITSLVTLFFESIRRLVARKIEQPKLLIQNHWITKKGARDENGKPFSFMIAGVIIENKKPFFYFLETQPKLHKQKSLY